MTKEYPRDLVGYGANPPNPYWPNRARIALQFVVNYEEGGENCVLHGDAGSEQFLSEIVGAESYPDRHLSMESIYEYGSRAGFWRLHRLFTQHDIPVTVFGVATALEKHPEAVEAMLSAKWEVASHGLRWIHYQDFSEQQERQHIEQAIVLHERITGSKPKGWYTGRTSPHTLKLIAERDDILYCADSYADDLPYWDRHYSKPLLMVPYTLDSNDMRFATPQGFNSGEQFYQYLKDAFDELYLEGKNSPKMLSIGLHCRLVGRPGRLAALRRFIEYTAKFDQVWYATREQIAEHWLATQSAPSSCTPTQAFKLADLSSVNDNTLAGELTGKRVSVKDLFDVKGFKTGAGLPAWLSDAREAKRHARAVELLAHSGAYLDHKTQLDELAYSLAGDNSHYGVSRNPLDHSRHSGGSSSGSAVSVALGQSDIGLATDTGGSIRVPASYCGLYGLRPTYGRVPTDGLVPLAPRFDTAGVLTRDLDDLELACKALFALDSCDGESGSIQQLLWCESLWEDVDVSLKQHALQCFDRYSGSKRKIASPPLDAQKRRDCFSTLQAVSIWQTHGSWLQNHIDEFGGEIRTRLRWGQSLISSDDGNQLIEQAEADLKHWNDVMKSWIPERSALLIPTTPSVAPEISVQGDSGQHRNTLLGLTSIAGLSGWPQLQTPVVIDGGLPMGLSLLGREKSDMELIELARQVLV